MNTFAFALVYVPPLQLAFAGLASAVIAGVIVGAVQIAAGRA